ncbi:MAG: UvrD-helicase domain-containing protein [Bacteroidales bacterium]|nr:UvrD-helicase domain-containing protein [Bacteroidales bacterium]
MSFTVYRSSAGSGKTYTLVKEYLGIVLADPPAYRNILAITFTNKAANEMRDRIIRSLTEIAEAEQYPNSNAVKYMLPELQRITGLERPLLIRNAGISLRNILHNYQDFAVSTIDSFIHRIIRTFSFDLHLPLNFEVEVDEDAMVTMAVDLLLSRVGMDKPLTNVLSRFTQSRILEEKNWDIEKDLKMFARRLLKDDIAEYLPGLQSMDTKTLLTVSNKLYSFINSFENDLSKKAAELVSLWERNGIEVGDLYYGKSGVYGYVSRFAAKNFSIPEPNSRVSKTLGEDQWYTSKLDSEKKSIIDGLKTEMLKILSYLVNYYEEHESRYILYGLLKRNIFPLAVLNEIEKVVDQIRENEGIIHISEFDKRIAAVVHHEPVPFIYERLGEKYKHFLIDEFQDTSVLEWQNIIPLVENSLAEGHFNMMVGDAKQAIYRFKGGEVEQLVKLPEIHKRPDTPEMKSREKLLERNYKPEKLKFNFRSREEIIKFNNALYSFIAEDLSESLKTIYADAVQESPEKKPGGEVRISFIEKQGNKSDMEPVYLEKVLGSVTELHEQKGYTLGDIAILCRSNKDASKIARHLLLHGIEVVSAESLLLSTSPEVHFLVFCLDYISNPDDHLALSGMITYLGNKYANTDFRHLLQNHPPRKRQEGGISINAAFAESLKSHGIRFIPDELKGMGLYEKLEAVIRTFSLNDSPDPYVVFFLDAAFDFEKNRRYDPEDFTAFWKENSHKYSIVVPEGMDAVSIMTIHKAKGLEFPAVIYPFANSKVDIGRDQKWVHIDEPAFPEFGTALLPMNKSLEKTVLEHVYTEELEMAKLDLLNILYVATTRPTERLYLLCDMPSEKSKTVNIPSILKAFLENQERWEDGTLDYAFGDQTPLARKDKVPGNPMHLGIFVSGNWKKNIQLSGHAVEYWDLEDEGRNLEWGNLVHKVLSGVVTIKDLDSVIGNEILQGNISGEKGNKLMKMLVDMLKQPEISPFFDGRYKIKNEAGILKAGGGEYRPDRLMFQDKKAIVLDYKTGKEDPKHIRQLEQYGQLLLDMGYLNVEKYLLYIDEEFTLLKV